MSVAKVYDYVKFPSVSLYDPSVDSVQLPYEALSATRNIASKPSTQFAHSPITLLLNVFSYSPCQSSFRYLSASRRFLDTHTETRDERDG